MKRALRGMAALGVSALALTACGDAPGDAGSGEGGGEAAESIDYKACMVSDQGGFDDKSFNQAGFEGLERAEQELGIEGVEVESQADTDYTPNINTMVSDGCDMVIGVGFLLEDPIQTAAEANPDTNFALIDSGFSAPDFTPVTLDNAKPILFNTAEAAFLAGYLAAGVSESGTVGTFGGLQIPSVSVFMDGFADGIAKHNADKGTSVRLVGWDKATQKGSFVGDFENQQQGQNITNSLIDQGADIVMPVAGPVGLGAIAAAKEAGDVNIIWVDSDGYETTEDGALILTSVMKKIGPAVFETLEQSSGDAGFSNEPYIGTLENDGVGLAPYHDFDSQVPDELKSEIDALREQIVSGDLVVESTNSPTSE